MNSIIISSPHREIYDAKSSGLSESNIDNEMKESNTPDSYDEKTLLTKNVFLSHNGKYNLSSKAIYCVILWYFFSFTTLFLNKYILSYEQGDPTLLGSVQLLICCICGYVHLKFPCGLFKTVKWERTPPRFFYNMLLVGSLRFSTLILGLIALWYVPVSFAETVKSSAPVFTVGLAWMLMGEKTSWLVCMSLLPIMGGLALCSANELSFNAAGFTAAMITNLSECLQNVYSKKLISDEKYSYSPPELQFYTSMASIGVQIPALILLLDVDSIYKNFNSEMLLLLIINGVSFHLQSITEYSLLNYISPVTHSVANTVKRAVLIWLSVITFGNKVTLLGGLGTTIVTFGVFGYNKAKQIAPTVVIPAKGVKEVHTI